MKEFKIPGNKIVRLVDHDGGCLATDRITVDGAKVSYMYREVTDRPQDTGWRFFAGDEDKEYMANKDHHGVYQVNTIANYSPEILPYLHIDAPCSFERIDGSQEFTQIDE